MRKYAQKWESTRDEEEICAMREVHARRWENRQGDEKSSGMEGGSSEIARQLMRCREINEMAGKSMGYRENQRDGEN